MGPKSYDQGMFIDGMPLVLAVGQTVTPAIDLGGYTLVGLNITNTLTGTSLTFEASDAIDGTFVPVPSIPAMTVASNNFYTLDPKLFSGLRFIKIVSNASQLTAPADFGLSVRGI